ncbi:MAG: aminoglycoside phosphotransferase family protein, partial [Chloroflexi bacterium]|nr:aminoglycoside phosphotransferase family protein [Chloroflexota bacterium]
MPEPTDLPEISDGDLGPIVKKICSGDLHGDRLIEPIGSSIGRATIGIYRVSGSAQPDSGKPEPWSAVLKIVDVDADPAGQLEFELSGSPEFLAIGNGLRPAVCYGTQDRGRSERWIWSEDLTDVSQPTWTDSVFLNVARDIGKFHANSIGKVPPGEWRRQGIYGSIMVSFGLAGSLERLPETASNALASPIFGETGVKAIAAVLQNYEAVANGLKHLTTVLVHNDCHVGNLYPIEKNGVHMETVAIDWATAGLGPLGEDAGNLIAVAVRRSQVDLDNFIDLERTTFDR